jgi:hypothetical protein
MRQGDGISSAAMTSTIRRAGVLLVFLVLFLASKTMQTQTHHEKDERPEQAKFDWRPTQVHDHQERQPPERQTEGVAPTPITTSQGDERQGGQGAGGRRWPQPRS